MPAGTPRTPADRLPRFGCVAASAFFDGPLIAARWAPADRPRAHGPN